jgi:hypothetical protein
VKVRYADTADALVLEITDPFAVILELDDGHRVLTPKLNALQVSRYADEPSVQAPPAPDDRDSLQTLAAPLLKAAHLPLADTTHCVASVSRPTRTGRSFLNRLAEMPCCKRRIRVSRIGQPAADPQKDSVRIAATNPRVSSR